MIPKIIHYCWFGGNPKEQLIVDCLKSWAIHLPEYEVIEWNESNIIIDCDFAKKAFELKKWAFLSDYIRLKALLEYGGVYLDTDMLFIKPLDQRILDHECFFGRQHDGLINASIIGSEKNNPFIEQAVSFYKKMPFNEQRLMSMAIPNIITELHNTTKFKVKIFDQDFFYPYAFEESLKGVDPLKTIQPNTYAIHLWNASWFNDKIKAGFAMDEGKYFSAISYLIKYFYKEPSAIINIPAVLVRAIKNKLGFNK